MIQLILDRTAVKHTQRLEPVQKHNEVNKVMFIQLLPEGF